MTHRLGAGGRSLLFCKAIPWACAFLLLFIFTDCARAWPLVLTSSNGAGLPFAFADFDGDQRADLAYVGTEEKNAGAAVYRLDFQLSAQGRKGIRIQAPPGGLFIEARDVNGDHTIDVVVSTAWLRQPVTILVNDGHGRFTALDKGDFRGLQSNRFSGSERLKHAACALIQSRGSCQSAAVSNALPETRFHSRFSVAMLLSLRDSPRYGRAPPIRV